DHGPPAPGSGLHDRVAGRLGVAGLDADGTGVQLQPEVQVVDEVDDAVGSGELVLRQGDDLADLGNGQGGPADDGHVAGGDEVAPVDRELVVEPGGVAEHRVVGQMERGSGALHLGGVALG